jgi:hypothetical protein
VKFNHKEHGGFRGGHKVHLLRMCPLCLHGVFGVKFFFGSASFKKQLAGFDAVI